MTGKIRFVYRAKCWDYPWRLDEVREMYKTFDEMQPITGERVGVVIADGGYSYELLSLHSIMELPFNFLWRDDWFSYQLFPDDISYAVQRLSELGLHEFVIDLLRQQKDAGFAPDDVPASPSFRL